MKHIKITSLIIAAATMLSIITGCKTNTDKYSGHNTTHSSDVNSHTFTVSSEQNLPSNEPVSDASSDITSSYQSDISSTVTSSNASSTNSNSNSSSVTSSSGNSSDSTSSKPNIPIPSPESIDFCLGIVSGSSIKPTEQLKLFKKAGFDAFFMEYSASEVEKCKKTADEIGMYFQSLHATYKYMRHMWTESEQTPLGIKELSECIDCCAKFNIPILIVHPFIGFNYPVPNDLSFGIENFRIIIDKARALGIKIAFENVEGEEYLAALMNEFSEYDNVGFCWDTGHEICYNRDKDMLELYGDKLIATHINDNFGISGDSIGFIDDLHVLPLDGVKNWDDAMTRLNKCEYNGIMTFELVISSDTDNKYGTDYSKMDFSDYLNLVYNRACQLRDIREQIKSAFD